MYIEAVHSRIFLFLGGIGVVGCLVGWLVARSVGGGCLVPWLVI